jgi:hypothetical protein
MVSSSANSPFQNTVWFSSFPNGRFSNSVFQYWFATYLQKQTEHQLIIGSPQRSSNELPWTMFDLPDHQQIISTLPVGQVVTKILLADDRTSPPASDLKKIADFFQANPGSVLAVDGFFQYDTGLMSRDPAYLAVFNEYLAPSAQYKTSFQRIIGQYQQQVLQLFKDKYLAAIHVRRGDYLRESDDIFFTLDLDQVVAQLKAFISRDHIQDPVIYVATDDPDFCQQYFTDKGLNINMSRNLVDAEKRNDVSDLMLDIAVLASAQLLVASNSSLSLLAALMNQRARLFWRQNKEAQLVSFDPWNTPILYGISNN